MDKKNHFFVEVAVILLPQEDLTVLVDGKD